LQKTLCLEQFFSRLYLFLWLYPKFFILKVRLEGLSLSHVVCTNFLIPNLRFVAIKSGTTRLLVTLRQPPPPSGGGASFPCGGSSVRFVLLSVALLIKPNFPHGNIPAILRTILLSHQDITWRTAFFRAQDAALSTAFSAPMC
jgi:hypothetical protein